ncbi:hypothetical protein ACFFR3_34900 [Nonomuraea salmonea]|uniref:HNH endonuclease n=1 Tax=Nonomuraea salmonea TaxID=46181 RepID=A0ABV5NWU6_9ACTN
MEMKRRQKGVGSHGDGNRQKRIKMLLHVPGYMPQDAASLERDLAEPPLAHMTDGVKNLPGSSVSPSLTFLGVLERLGRAPRRGEQANLRMLLLPTSVQFGTCALCGYDLPPQMLVAAHIKRRKDCSNLERRDLANVGMLACLLGCDVLYELGYVGVGEGGLIMISDVIRTAPSLLNHVTGRLSGRTTPWWSPTREKYFAWHRTVVFQSGHMVE